MVTLAWSDLNKDGRRLEKIIKYCLTMMEKEVVFEMKMAWLDRIIKATNTKVHIAEIVLGIKEILRQKIEKAG
jgi:hypothetical protein